ncbi:MAG: pilus assembly PilX N-terminal domain-containing protein [Endomicrobiales bacterium]|nr:pilus assembly PilX N-terminal domain-containing protein [Endomicrobiales bacterium]
MKKGAILFTVLIFSFVLSIIGMALIYIYGEQRMQAIQASTTTKALYAAESGAELARSWLYYLQVFPENRPGHSDDTNPFYVHNARIIESGANYQVQMTVSIDPFDANVSTSAQTAGYYLVETQGLYTTNVTGSEDFRQRTENVIEITTGPWRVRQVIGSWKEFPIERVIH